jgi:hypothetical protein
VVLQAIPFKILIKMLKSRLEKVYDGHLSVEQHEFWKKKGTGIAIKTIIDEIELAFTGANRPKDIKGKSLFVGFVDFEKAFDCIDRSLQKRMQTTKLTIVPANSVTTKR